MKSNKYTVDDLMKCKSLFEKKGWDHNSDRYNAFVDRYINVDDDGKSLLMELTDSFLLCEDMLEIKQMYVELLEFVTFDKDSTTTFIILPFKKISDEKNNKEKSSDLMYKLINIFSSDFKFQLKFCDKVTDAVDCFGEKSFLLLIEDFIGTGDSANEIIAELNQLFSIQKKELGGNYMVVCLYAMQEGLNYLNNLKIQVCHWKSIPKGISGNLSCSQAEINNKRKIMKNIENSLLLNLKSNMSLGYKESEALLCILDKCPNNTFPIYWYPKFKKKGVDKVIFNRIKNDRNDKVKELIKIMENEQRGIVDIVSVN